MERIRKEREEREKQRKEFLAQKEREADQMRQRIKAQKQKLDGKGLKCFSTWLRLCDGPIG